MQIRDLILVNYKNFAQAELSFSPKLNCFIGNNGVGKTNLLDSLYYLSFCKSYFNIPDSQVVRNFEEFFMLQATYQQGGGDTIIHCGYKVGQKKTFRRDKKEYDRLSDHIGLIPLVMISPNDSVLVQGGSEERRKFIDSVISQYDRQYLELLLKYNRALLQRNNLLKQFATLNRFDNDVLEPWSELLISVGERIHEKRVNFLAALTPVFQNYYDLIAQGHEQVILEYQSQLNEGSFRHHLDLSLVKDRQLQFTTVGIHRDDLILKIGQSPIKRFGSQGQTKTFLVALKFAQYEFMRGVHQLRPILLLDDLFDKLDALRVEQIIQLVSGDHFGQIFITDTNREHLDAIIRKLGTDFKIFQVVDGEVKTESD